MTFADYAALPGINASLLKLARKSALHYHYFSEHEVPDSPAMFKGRYMHCCVLEPDEFPKKYTVWPEVRRGNAWLEFAAASEDAGMEVLTRAEYDDALTVRDAVRAHPVASKYLSEGEPEVTVQWTDPDTGLACKGRPDWLRPGLLISLKTSERIDHRNFERTTHDFGYHISEAHYVNGLQLTRGGEWQVKFIAVESKPPHDVRCGPLSDDALWAGQQEVKRLLRLVKDCTESGIWPGAYPDESEFDLPPWFYAQGERELEGLA